MSKSKASTANAGAGVQIEAATAATENSAAPIVSTGDQARTNVSSPTAHVAPSDTTAPALAEYEVISPLRYNRKRYEIGERVLLSDPVATPLIDRVVKRSAPAA